MNTGEVLPSLSYRSFESRDGARICYGRIGRGPPLVMVHGTRANHLVWHRLAVELRGQHSCYLVDRRGCGESEDRDPYSPEHEYDDLATFLDLIPGRPALLAHSFGALCALEVAMRGCRATHLVLHEPPVTLLAERPYPADLVAALEDKVRAGDREGAVMAVLSAWLRRPPSYIRTLRASSDWTTVVAAIPTVVREMRAANDYLLDVERLRRLQLPTLLMAGGTSSARVRETVNGLGSAIVGSTVQVVPGAGHMAIITHPRLLATLIGDFLSEDRAP